MIIHLREELAGSIALVLSDLRNLGQLESSSTVNLEDLENARLEADWAIRYLEGLLTHVPETVEVEDEPE